MYRRCETYPQYAKTAIALTAMPGDAWYPPEWATTQAKKLLNQATPEQLLQFLKHAQQHPDEWWTVQDHLLIQRQVTADQLLWSDTLSEYVTLGYATTAKPTSAGRDAYRCSIEHIRQHLLGGDVNAWDVFLGIAGPGTLIGGIAAVAAAIER